MLCHAWRRQRKRAWRRQRKRAIIITRTRIQKGRPAGALQRCCVNGYVRSILAFWCGLCCSVYSGLGRVCGLLFSPSGRLSRPCGTRRQSIECKPEHMEPVRCKRELKSWESRLEYASEKDRPTLARRGIPPILDHIFCSAGKKLCDLAPSNHINTISSKITYITSNAT